MRLDHKVALVTGGAGGLGAQTARLFAAEGAELVVIADIEDGTGVAREINEAGGRAIYHPLDVTDDASWALAIETTLSMAVRLDVLVNNAGISGASGAGYDQSQWDQLMAVNATGVFLGLKHATKAMLLNPEDEGPRGSIVNVSSIAGLVGHAGLHLGYNASKGAVRLLTKGAAARHGVDGIRVNSVHPGLLPPMRTSTTTRDPVKRSAILQNVPLRRKGELGEVAQAILFLASDDASYITGAELAVDGGYTAV